MWRTMYKQRNCRWVGDEDSHTLCADSCADNYLPSPALNQRGTQVQIMIMCSEKHCFTYHNILGQTSSDVVP